MGQSHIVRIRLGKTRKIIVVTLLFCTLFFAFSFLFAGANGRTAQAEKITRGATHVVLEASSLRVLSENNARKRKEPASTTKILTAVCVLENLDVEKEITIPNGAAGVEGSSIYLKAGEKWKVKDLLYGLMLRSGNDAATALALSVSGSVEKFAAVMNATACKIGAFDSNFTNPHGLHNEKHYTTAYDLALITAYAYRYPLFREIVSCKEYVYTQNGVKGVFVNKNKMLSHYEGANGVKTGYTTASGRCLVSGAVRQGMQLICVVLDEGNMWGKSAELLNEAFERYRLHTLFKKGEPFMVNGKTFTVGKDMTYPLKDGEKDSLRYEYVLRAPFPAGKEQDGGRLYVKLANRLIFSEKVYTI